MDGYFCSKAIAIIQHQTESDTGNDNCSCNVFDLHGNSLHHFSIPQMPENLHLAQVISNERYIFVISGKDKFHQVTARCYKLDMKYMSWSRIADLKDGRQFHTACIAGNRIYVTGGFNGNDVFS